MRKPKNIDPRVKEIKDYETAKGYAFNISIGGQVTETQNDLIKAVNAEIKKLTGQESLLTFESYEAIHGKPYHNKV